MFKPWPQKNRRVAVRTRRKRAASPRLARQKVARRGRKQGASFRPDAARLLSLVGRATGLAGLFLAVSLLLCLVFGFLASSSAFAVRQLEITGSGDLPRKKLMRAAGITFGQSILTLPVGKLERRLAELPGVVEARVDRELPSKVVIRLTRPEPRFLVLAAGRLFHLDRDFRLMGPATAGQAWDLPVISGLSPADLLKPDEEARDLLAQARRLVDLLPPADLSGGGGLSEIHLDRVWGISLVLNHHSATVRLGFGRLAEKLARLARVRNDLKRRGEAHRAVAIDLAAKDRVIVRLGNG